MHAPRLISLFSGAGGLDYGFEAAGFETAVATDYDAEACSTLRHNRSWPVVEGAIEDIPTSRLLEISGLQVGEADLLIGGPPCQPFSKAGYWARGESLRLNDPRAATLNAYVRVLEEAQPRAFLLENVEGLSYSGKSEGIGFLLEGIQRINAKLGTNYRPHYKVLRAADFGVPQLRARFFLIAARDGQTFHFPSPSHRADEPVGPLDRELPPYRTAWDALGDLPPPDNLDELAPSGKWAELLPTIPEGQNYLWHTDRGGGEPLFGWRRRYWSFLLKLAKNQPSWTIQAQPGPATGPFHWDSRRLSMRELCRLQTFPDDVEIVGRLRAVQRQVGNAVPSLLAEVLGREIRTQLLGLPALRTPLKLLPPSRLTTPEPEKLPDEIPETYRERIGAHSAHPGTGKGRRAAQRNELPAK
ncbi:MAG: DNA cytosine methyltransferase [Alphaproteobacteria bacterium]|nr:DNA cytosine methyltransferase [Alphaproteobacteria bacterium]